MSVSVCVLMSQRYEKRYPVCLSPKKYLPLQTTAGGRCVNDTPIRYLLSFIYLYLRLWRQYEGNHETTAGGRCVKDTPKSIFLYLSVTLYVMLWDPGGLAGAQRRLVNMNCVTIICLMCTVFTIEYASTFRIWECKFRSEWLWECILSQVWVLS